MNTPRNEFSLAWKAFWQLGWKVSLLYAWYQFTLRIGLLKKLTPAHRDRPGENINIKGLDLSFPSDQEYKEILGNKAKMLLQEADEIIAGKVRLFGGPPHTLNLKPPVPYSHWTTYKSSILDGQDIKLTWEIGRFGWATVLARAYHFSRDEKYAEAFWKYTEEFIHHNPPNLGPHWVSAQEAALRLIAQVFSYTLFASSPYTTPQRVSLLANTLIAHASRIPPTLSYARAQNNNHLLTEAAGLYTAAAVLPDHPEAPRWRNIGWKWFNRALQTQIAPDGAYIQNSANYHRLMLQAALWFAKIAESQNDELPKRSLTRLASATRWLLTLLDQESGNVPNLGANDGAYILPLTTSPFSDYRPVLKAAGEAFLGNKPNPDNHDEEMSTWLCPQKPQASPSDTQPNLLIIKGESSWAYLRAAEFTHRPGHADQLHLDLWWRGLNVAQDAGTYLYNGEPPWDNPLVSTIVHNTITINGGDQMTKAGRFLWLDWAKANIVGMPTPTRVSAEHGGYKKLGVTHQRKVEITSSETWKITDTISANRNSPFTIRLHWLLPDWEWKLENTSLRLKSPHGWVTLEVSGDNEMSADLARAGEILQGEGQPEPTRGWVSPTYNLKTPALSFAVTTNTALPCTLISKWEFPG